MMMMMMMMIIIIIIIIIIITIIIIIIHHELGLDRPVSASSNTDMRRLTTDVLSEKCFVRRFRCCTNVIDSTYTNLDSIDCYTLKLYGIAYCS